MDYNTSLLTGAEIGPQVTLPNLANLAASGELVLNTLALKAHQWVYARLEKNGVDPTLLTNASRLHDAIAYEAVARGVMSGQIRVPNISPDAYHLLAIEAVDSFTPVYASTDSARRASEGIPAVGHIDAGVIFSGEEDRTPVQGYFNDDYPSAI